MNDAIGKLRPGPIDIHAHILPEALIRRISAGERPGFGVDLDERGGRWVRLGAGGPRVPLLPGMAVRLRTMEAQGVAAQLLSPWIALAAYHLGEDDAVWFATALNEEIAAVVRRMPDRFVGIGSVPLQAPEAAARMVRWLMTELGLSGVEIATNADPRPAARRPVARAVHGGGFLPYNAGRLRRGRLVRPETQGATTDGMDEALGRFLFDTVTHSASALRFLVGEAGADKVLLGSDYPFDMGDPMPVETVRTAAFDRADEGRILRENAERLFCPHGRAISRSL